MDDMRFKDLRLRQDQGRRGGRRGEGGEEEQDRLQQSLAGGSLSLHLVFHFFVNSCFKKHRNKEQLKAQNVTINNVEYSKMHTPPLKNKGKSCLPLSSNQSNSP